MALIHGPNVVRNGLVLNVDAASIQSYPGSGTTWTNVVNNSINMTLNAGPTYTSGARPYFTFDGTDDYAQTTAQILSGTTSTSFTLEAVAMSTTAVSWQTVLGTAGTLRQIGFNGTSFYWGGNGGGGNSFVNGGTISANTWYHLAFTFDGTTGSLGTGYGYLNGVQTTGSIGHNGGTIGVNMLSTYSPNTAAERLTGRIALARIYNRALTFAEIQQNYQTARLRYGI